MIGKLHRIYQCGFKNKCKCFERVFKAGDLVAFLYSTDGMGEPTDRGDLGILIDKEFEDTIIDEKSGYTWKMIYWTVYHQLSGKYYSKLESEFDFAEDLGIYHD